MELSRDIEESRNIKWEKLKKLKSSKKDPEQLDLNDLSNFYKFFEDLYKGNPLDHSITYPEPNFEERLSDSTELDILQDSLNAEITIEELNRAIAKLKVGKATGEDCISNEFLICPNMQLKLTTLHLFNQCLENGIYP